MNTHALRTRLGVAAGGLLAAGGLAAFTLAGATGASATGTTGTTTTSVAVAYSTTLTDSTPSISFSQPASLPNWTSFNSVAISGTNNDPNGWTSTVTATDLAEVSPGTGNIPASNIALYGAYEPAGFPSGAGSGFGGKTPTGNPTPFGVFTEGTAGTSQPLVVDATSAASLVGPLMTPAYSDGYALYVGLGIAPGTYNGALNYVFSSN